MASPGTRRPQRPDPPALELADTRVVAAGTVLWLVALLALALYDLAGARVPGWWLWMCGCGATLGVLGLRVVARRRQRRR